MTDTIASEPSIVEVKRADAEGPIIVPLTKDDAFHLLQNSRRRAVLRYILAEEKEQYVMRDVAEAVAAWEHNTTVAQLTSAERQPAYISLYQSHLPKLAEYDIIDYDQNRGFIKPRPRIALLIPFLDEGLDAPSELTLDEIKTEDTPQRGGLRRFLSF